MALLDKIPQVKGLSYPLRISWIKKVTLSKANPTTDFRKQTDPCRNSWFSSNLWRSCLLKWAQNTPSLCKIPQKNKSKNLVENAQGAQNGEILLLFWPRHWRHLLQLWPHRHLDNILHSVHHLRCRNRYQDQPGSELLTLILTVVSIWGGIIWATMWCGANVLCYLAVVYGIRKSMKFFLLPALCIKLVWILPPTFLPSKTIIVNITAATLTVTWWPYRSIILYLIQRVQCSGWCDQRNHQLCISQPLWVS